MAARRSGYSRLVGILGLGLPVTALLILATLFYLSKPINIDTPAPVAGIDIASLIRQSGIGTPNFVGRTEDGSTLRMNAERAFSLNADLQGLSARKVSVTLERDGQQQFYLSADQMELPDQDATATFTGQVLVRPGDGMDVRTDRLEVAHDLSSLAAPGPISADAPFGTLTADSMTATRQSAAGAAPGYLTVFQGGVRLIYRPQQSKQGDTQ